MREKETRTIAFGDLGITLNRILRNRYLWEDGSLCYFKEDNAMSYINALAQARIMGEDAAAAENNESGILLKVFNRVVYGSQKEFESYLKDTINHVIEDASNLGLQVIERYESSYLFPKETSSITE